MAKPPNELPTQAEYNITRAWYMTIVGMTGQEVNEMIGVWGEYTRGQIAERSAENQRNKADNG